MKKIEVVHMVFVMILMLMFAQSGPAQVLSENALLQRKIFVDPDVWHLTKAYANSEWGVDLYAYPTSVSMTYIIDSTNGDIHSAMSFTSDYAFHRIVYSEAYSNWIRAYGSFGEDIGQFNSPSGIVAFNRPTGDSENHHVYVADTWNNRICGLTYNWSSQQFSDCYQITGGGLTLPRGLDINNGGEFGDADNDRLWVANGDNTIKKFDLDGNLLLTFGDFDDLRGIACGRSNFTDQPPPYERFANNNFIYVIEDTYIHQLEETSPGNIQYIRSHNIAPSFPPWPPPPPWPEQMTSIDVDNVGQIWTTVVDTTNETSRIDKYTPDLDFLCSFDAGGIFNHLLCFTHSGGKWGCGNVIVLEEWDDGGGAFYYWIETDIINYTTGSDSEHENHYAAYTLVDPAWVSVKVYDEDETLIKTVKDTIPRFLDYSGYQIYWWDGSDNSGQIAHSGNYRINVIAYSAYLMGTTAAHTNIVSKDGWVHHIDYTEPMNTPAITSVDAVDTSLFVHWEDNNINELGYIIDRKDDTNPLWITLDTTNWDEESYNDYDITGSETYYYRIRAYNYLDSTEYSNTISKKARPFPPLDLYVENFYCNRDYRPIGKLAAGGEEVKIFKLVEGNCIPPYPDSIPSDASAIYADYPIRQKFGTFAGMEVWSKHCSWYNHNVIKNESTFVDLNRHMLVQTDPDTVYCSDWTYYFKVRTIDVYGDSSMCWPPGELDEISTWGWPYACCVGPCHINLHQSNPVFLIETPSVFSLGQNHPNPFNPETQIKYDLPEAVQVNLVIYNILGQRVRTLVDEHQEPGYRTVIWDGRDERGREVASGIYFYRLKAGDYDQVKKMLVLK